MLWSSRIRILLPDPGAKRNPGQALQTNKFPDTEQQELGRILEPARNIRRHNVTCRPWGSGGEPVETLMLTRPSGAEP